MNLPHSITGTISVDKNISGTINNHGAASAISSYDGEYEVTPNDDVIILSTKNKRMENDVTVFAIPYWETDNDFGTTVYIGGSDDYGIQ